MSNVRDIEKIIDEAHKEHAILKLHKKQAIHDILATFEDMCSLVFMGSMLTIFIKANCRPNGRFEYGTCLDQPIMSRESRRSRSA